MEYRSDIDGLRAIAVLTVIFFHAGFTAFSGGYLGVDIFFVISGFLITGIIKGDIDKGSFSLLKFYNRRARRILPALIAIILGIYVVSYFVLIPNQWKEFNESVVAVSVFASNIYFLLTTGYFDVDAEYKLLIHTWTLSLEEQFYILFPLAIILFDRFKKNIGHFVIIAFLGSLLLSEYLSRQYVDLNYYILPTRAWQLLAGSICAIYRPDIDRLNPFAGRTRLREIVVLSALVVIVLSTMLFDAETRNPSLITLIPIFACCVLMMFGQDSKLANRILAVRPMIFIGLISYSAYLWHQPVFVFYRLTFFDHSVLGAVICILLTLFLSYLTYRFVEQPFRRGSPDMSHKKVLAVSVASLTCLALFAFTLSRTKPGYLPSVAQLGDTAYAGESYNWRNRVDGSGGEGGILLYGDSHARHYAPWLEELARSEKRSFEFLGAYSCLSFAGIQSLYRGQPQAECRDSYDTLKSRLISSRQTLVIAQRWDGFIADRNGQAFGEKSILEDRNVARNLFKAIQDTIAELPQDQAIILIGFVPTTAPAGPEYREGYLRCRQYVDRSCSASYPRHMASNHIFVNGNLRAIAELHKNVSFIDPFDHLCDDQNCHIKPDSGLIYHDQGHLTRHGVGLVLDPHRDLFSKDR